MTDRAAHSHRALAMLVAIVAALALWACSGGDADGRAADDSGPWASGGPTANAALGYSVRRYVRGADQAVGLAFDTRGRLLYAEKDSGRIIRFAKGRKTVLASLNVAGGGEAGLLGLTMDANGFLYAYYTSTSASCPDPTKPADGGGIEGHCVWRFKPTGSGRMRADGLVFSAGHPSTASNHVGGGLHIGPGDALYLSIGDLGENDDPNKGPGRAQDLSLPFGKILRLDPGATNMPADGNSGACFDADYKQSRKTSDDRIWACGLRNTYQFTFDRLGNMWGAEAGDSCDEINRIIPGGNYGWQPPRTDCSGSGPGKPILKVTGTPSGITVPTAASAGSWRDDVFYCIFDGNKLMHFDPTRRKSSELRKAAGHCSYDLISRGNRFYMSSGTDIYRLSIKR